MRKSAIILAGLATLASTPALAADYLFTLSGSAQASFKLSATPTPLPVNVSDGISFRLENITGIVDGTQDNQIALTFYSAGSEGGLEIGSFTFYSLVGPQLYTGTEVKPTFTIGTFALDDFFTRGTGNNSSLTISAVPEPATWGMLILGFGAVGATLRYRRRAAGAPALNA